MSVDSNWCDCCWWHLYINLRSSSKFFFKTWNEINVWKSKQPKIAEPSWPICKLEDRLARLPWWTCVFGQFPHLIQDKNGLVFLYASSSFINQMKRNLKEKKTLKKLNKQIPDFVKKKLFISNTYIQGYSILLKTYFQWKKPEHIFGNK